ncbi:protein FAR1-RELATED SEQUENCE 5-like [Silene latifolia]|uniref:protein FAR1-RELATED SEQUENCE 5-like n=1 Tax=Silene latifolia TaxID=37657 RepID=UPI003D77656B
MDFELNMPWEDDLDNISLEDVDNNVELQEDGDDQEDVVSFNEFSLDELLYDDGVDGEPVNNGGEDNDEDDVNDEGVGNEEDVIENEVVIDDLHEPPVVEGGYVQKVAKFLKSGYTDNVELDPPAQRMHFVNGDEFGKGVKRYGAGKSEPCFYMYKRVRLCCTRAAKSRKKNIEVSSFKPCQCVIEATLLDDFIVIKHARLDHNHDDLNPANSRHMVGYRVWDEYFKRRALMNDEAGIPIAKNFNTLVREVGGHGNLTASERDLRNMLNQERQRSRIQGDANALEERFIKLKEVDPNFYYAIETDQKGMYKMPFTPFVGVNHHGCTVGLASALISYEDAVSFTWVFRRWLDCIGRAPSVIITDQCRGIGLAVKTVFSNTPHHLYLWHIMRNSFKNLGCFARFREIQADLRDVVYESKDIDDFEASWQIFIDKYGIRRHARSRRCMKKGRHGFRCIEGTCFAQTMLI